MNNIYLLTADNNNLIINQLISLFNINIIKTTPIINIPYLEFKNDQLWLKHNNLSGLNLDELYQKIINRQNTSKELIIKAHKHNNTDNKMVSILDLTAGLGKDALILQQNNFQITLIEYNLLLIIILNYAKLKGYFNNNTSIINANSYDFIQNYNFKHKEQHKLNIYYDPMFKQNKTALSKKDMQYIDLLTNNDNISKNEEEIFNFCYNSQNVNKIVIKRDNKQLLITSKIKLNYSLKSKLIRFDIYQKSYD